VELHDVPLAEVVSEAKMNMAQCHQTTSKVQRELENFSYPCPAAEECPAKTTVKVEVVIMACSKRLTKLKS
jgi:hypothetical protein